MTIEELKKIPKDEIVIRSRRYGVITKAQAFNELMKNKNTRRVRYIERKLNYLKPER